MPGRGIQGVNRRRDGVWDPGYLAILLTALAMAVLSAVMML